MTQQEALQWLIDNGASFSFEIIGNYNYLLITVRNQKFRVSVSLEDKVRCSFISAVSVFRYLRSK